MESGMQDVQDEHSVRKAIPPKLSPQSLAEELPYIPNSKASGYEWTKQLPANRVYIYPNNQQMNVKGVTWVSVKKTSKGHSHRLYTQDGTSVYMPSGWLCITWPGKFEF